MDIRMQIPDDYCQGEAEHTYSPDEVWYDDEEDRAKARPKIKPRNRA